MTREYQVINQKEFLYDKELYQDSMEEYLGK
jgi:hypothetical protein